MKNNNIYLENYVYKDALDKYKNILHNKMKLEIIEISAKESFGYILSEPIFAKVSAPNFTASAMDGIAIDYKKTLEASENNHIELLENIDYMVVDTGDYIEPKYNAVIMVEDIINIEECKIKITSPIGFFENIRSVGEDIVKTQMVLPSFHKIRPVDIGAIIASGVENVKVFRPFNVGIMPTGTEIVDITKGNFKKGDIIDSNSYMLKALVEEMGFKGHINDIVKDDYNLLKENIIKMIDKNDIVFINAGSSAGREDFTKDILAELGEVIIHGVAIKPGKPVILAVVNNKMVVGIPGYSVSCYMVFEKIIKPILNSLLKVDVEQNHIEATLTKQVNSSLKHLEFVRVKVGFVNDKWIATPLARGAGVSMSLVDCDGILEVPKEFEGYNSGESVTIKLNKDISELKKRLTSIGSHDMIIDVLRDQLICDDKNIDISSTHLGSFGGVIALKNKECDFAPIHILDEDTGLYNIGAINKFFKDEKMVLIKGVQRQQGLYVAKGNPKNIKGIKDIVNHKYANRQSGSGTYILLEYLLKENDINEKDVVGFDFNLPTHFDVAINVKEGITDCGLGVYSVAKSLDIDFVHIINEDYDFLIYEKDLEKEYIKLFIDTLKSDNFKKKIEELGGYETNHCGEIIYFGK